MPTNSPQTVWNNLHQGTMTGPQYVAAFEKAYYALPPHNRPDEAAAVSLLFYRANEQVQNKIRAANGNDNDIPTFWSLSDMMDAIRSTPNPAHAKPVHPCVWISARTLPGLTTAPLQCETCSCSGPASCPTSGGLLLSRRVPSVSWNDRACGNH